MLGTLTENQKGVNNYLSAVQETLIIRGVHEVVKSPEFMSRFLNAVIENPGFIAPETELVTSEQQKLVTEQAKIKEIFRQFLKARTKMKPRPVLAPSEGSDQPPNDISDEKTNPRSHLIQHSQSG